MPESCAHHELHEALAAEHGDDLDGHAVLTDHDRAVSDDAAERRVARPDLLCHIDAAAPDFEGHVEAGFGEIALAFGELDRAEGGKKRRRREEIGDCFACMDWHGRSNRQLQREA